MAYNSALDAYVNYGPADGTDFGRSGAAITPNDSTDLTDAAGNYIKTVVVTVAGNLSIVPYGNADAAPIVFTAVPVGFIPPFFVRRVRSTGTTASVASVLG